MGRKIRRHARCTLCGKWVDLRECKTFHEVTRVPYVSEKKRWTERRGRSWYYCDECGDMIAKWMDANRKRNADWRDR
jgi:hypothetical protein